MIGHLVLICAGKLLLSAKMRANMGKHMLDVAGFWQSGKSGPTCRPASIALT